jgi:ribosome-binding factor A
MVERKDRLASFLKREIANCLVTELRDPRLGVLITVTRVEVTGDLHQATAYFTLLGDAKQRKLAEHALRRAAPFIQARYAPELHMRTVPQLRFAYDEVQEKRTAMDELIARARASDPDGGSQPTTPVADPAVESPDDPS